MAFWPNPDPVAFLIGITLSLVFGIVGLVFCILDNGIDGACIWAFLGLVILLVMAIWYYLQNIAVPSLK